MDGKEAIYQRLIALKSSSNQEVFNMHCDQESLGIIDTLDSYLKGEQVDILNAVKSCSRFYIFNNTFMDQFKKVITYIFYLI